VTKPSVVSILKFFASNIVGYVLSNFLSCQRIAFSEDHKTTTHLKATLQS